MNDNQIGWAITDKGVEKLSREYYVDDYGYGTYSWKNITRGFNYIYCDYNLFHLYGSKKEAIASTRKPKICKSCGK
jgi:hypothetical protein